MTDHIASRGHARKQIETEGRSCRPVGRPLLCDANCLTLDSDAEYLIGRSDACVIIVNSSSKGEPEKNTKWPSGKAIIELIINISLTRILGQ